MSKHTKLNILADYLETDPRRFNMGDYEHCIAGQTLKAFGVTTAPGDHPHDLAMNTLGITEEEAMALFLPNRAKGIEEYMRATSKSPYSASAYEAAKVVRNLALTGEVNWEAAIPELEPA